MDAGPRPLGRRQGPPRAKRASASARASVGGEVWRRRAASEAAQGASVASDRVHPATWCPTVGLACRPPGLGFGSTLRAVSAAPFRSSPVLSLHRARRASIRRWRAALIDGSEPLGRALIHTSHVSARMSGCAAIGLALGPNRACPELRPNPRPGGRQANPTVGHHVAGSTRSSLRSSPAAASEAARRRHTSPPSEARADAEARFARGGALTAAQGPRPASITACQQRLGAAHAPAKRTSGAAHAPARRTSGARPRACQLDERSRPRACQLDGGAAHAPARRTSGAADPPARWDERSHPTHLPVGRAEPPTRLPVGRTEPPTRLPVGRAEPPTRLPVGRAAWPTRLHTDGSRPTCRRTTLLAHGAPRAVSEPRAIGFLSDPRARRPSRQLPPPKARRRGRTRCCGGCPASPPGASRHRRCNGAGSSGCRGGSRRSGKVRKIESAPPISTAIAFSPR